MQSQGVSATTMGLVHLRASQINGCSFCVDSGAKQARREGETEERLSIIVAWRDAPYFSDEERAALALAEAVTRLSDGPDPVSEEVWQDAAHHFAEPQLAALLLWIATTNFFNRLNASTRQPAGSAIWSA